MHTLSHNFRQSRIAGPPKLDNNNNKSTTETPFLLFLIPKSRFLHQYLMDFAHSWTQRMVNPYARRSTANVSENGGNSNNLSHNYHSRPRTTMGIQSQRRDGSIAKCRKRATRTKHVISSLVQRSMQGGVAFVPHLHCKQCVGLREYAAKTRASKPHKVHHPRCPHNTKTRGFTTTTTADVERTVATNIRINNMPIMASRLHNRAMQSTPSVNRFFGLGCQQQNQNSTSTTSPNTTNEGILSITTPIQNCSRVKSLFSATKIKKELESMYQDYKNNRKYKRYDEKPKKHYSIAFGLAAEYITSLVEHRKPIPTVQALSEGLLDQEGIKNFHHIFSLGCCFISFPPDFEDPSKPPSPLYHTLEGLSIGFVD